MTQKTKTLTGFIELTSSELHHISGGNWWSDWAKMFPKMIKVLDNSNGHKIG